jgi:methanethiol S-methyltransferase
MNIFWLVFSVLVWGFLHSLTASYPFKAWIRRLFGPRADQFYRLLYNIFSLISFLGILIIAFFTPDQTLYIVSMPWAAIMLLGELAAFIALLVAFRQTDMLDFIGLRQLMVDQGKTHVSKLVTDGLYRYIRHPLYTSGLLFIWLFPIMTARQLVLNIALTLYIVVGAYYEERKLRQKFGQEYIQYSAVTPMFIPLRPIWRELKRTK